jgi:large subunit ribosomal protein L25
MASGEATRLNANARETTGSRAMRRLRRDGRVPGVLYGGEGEPVPFDVDARELRHALHASGAVLEVAIGGDTATAVVKDTQRHPVRGETLHLDLVRVRMDVAIQSTVVLELTGVDDAPGVKEGGVLEQITREITVEALPGDIPETLAFDASGLEPGATVTLAEVTAPANVTIVDDGETVVATITAPRLELETEEEIEAETELVGEGEAEAAGEEEATADEAAEAAAQDADTTSE